MKIIKIFIFSFIINLVFSNDFDLIEESFNENNISTFYLSSFDMVTGATDIELFRYRIKVLNNQLLENDDLELRLNFSMTVTSPMIGYNNATEILSGFVKISDIKEDIIFDNTDLNINTTRIGSSIFSVDILNQPDNETIQSIANAVLQMGRLPNGEYNFDVDLIYDGVLQQSLTRPVEIYFPVFLELVSPGGSSLADTLENSIFTTYPVFQWESDYCPTCIYGIRVSEYNPILHSSFSEAINDISNLPISQSADYYDIGTNISTFQFPLSGGIDLLVGKLYVWQVARSFETTLGTNLTKSNINLFKIKSVSESREALDSYSDIIIDLIGETTYNQFFGPNGDFSDFNLSGNSILINNESVPISQLNNFSNQLNEGTISIISIEVE
ncbi:MAG: hypothetical protein CMG07_01425 [Candidatus Marinimicrobia bacterium]|nr:hypothetical protein [Candidatus Neomarinimicrobiota bacterium]|tara:strand:+ start:210 stop:1367 length:1158 start_codon:yes stop_codon:yes gene_type:complete